MLRQKRLRSNEIAWAVCCTFFSTPTKRKTRFVPLFPLVRNKSLPTRPAIGFIDFGLEPKESMKHATVEDLCARLACDDPTLEILKCHKVDNFDETKLRLLLKQATSFHTHLKAFYAAMDHTSIEGWASLAHFLNASESLEKLWIFCLRSGSCPAACVSHFFSVADPHRVSIQGLGLEIQEPERTFHAKERNSIERFFALNTSITILNILCEVQPIRHKQKRRIINHNGYHSNSSFLDCVLNGLAFNKSVSHLILRHSNTMVHCRLELNEQALRSFFEKNESVDDFGVLIGSSHRAAASIARSLQHNRKPRRLYFHEMSEAASLTLFDGLPKAKNVEELSLVNCLLDDSTVHDKLSEGVRGCNGLLSLCVEFSDTFVFTPSLDDLLTRIGPVVLEHPSLTLLVLSFPRAVLHPLDAKSIGMLMSHKTQKVMRLSVVVYQMTKGARDVLSYQLKDTPSADRLEIVELHNCKPTKKPCVDR